MKKDHPLNTEQEFNCPPMTAGQAPDMESFATGANRGSGVAGQEGWRFPLRYELLFSNFSFMQRMAQVYGEGALKYGDENWRQGLPEKSLVNHALAHLIQHLSGDTTEDHLAHMCWGVMTLMWVQDNKPELLDLCKLASSKGITPDTDKGEVLLKTLDITVEARSNGEFGTKLDSWYVWRAGNENVLLGPTKGISALQAVRMAIPHIENEQI